VPVDFANCRKRSAHSRSWETLPGIDVGSHNRLNRIDYGQVGAAGADRRNDGVGICFAQKQQVVGVEAHPPGAQANLRHRFFARDVQDLARVTRDLVRNLAEQRRLANTWIAADQGDRALDDATAQDARKLVNSDG
jgi:hypothetical protein